MSDSQPSLTSLPHLIGPDDRLVVNRVSDTQKPRLTVPPPIDESDGDVYSDSDSDSESKSAAPSREPSQPIAPESDDDDYDGTPHHTNPRDEVMQERFASFSNPMKRRAVPLDYNSESESEGESPTNLGSERSKPEPVDDHKRKLEERQLKMDILTKIEILKQKGHKFPKEYSLSSPLIEIDFEYNRVRKSIDVKNGLAFSRNMLITVSSGIEMLNRRFNPLNLKLDGWSTTVQENIGSYDEVLEELVEKYSKKTNMPPELRLLVMLVGSAFVFHATNAIIQNMMPDVMSKINKNESLKQNLEDTIFQAMKKPDPEPEQRKMSGPSIALAGDDEPLPAIPEPDLDRFSEASSESASSRVSTGSKRGRKIKLPDNPKVLAL